MIGPLFQQSERYRRIALAKRTIPRRPRPKQCATARTPIAVATGSRVNSFREPHLDALDGQIRVESSGLPKAGAVIAWHDAGRSALPQPRDGSAMRVKKILTRALLAALALGAANGARADEAKTAAVFDAVFVNSSPQETSPEETARVQRMTKELKLALEKSGQYRVVDLAPIETQIDAVKDIHDCNGCEAELAKKAGAQIAIVAWAQKISNLILNLNIRIEDAATGETLKGGSVDIRGNSDQSWDRGLKYLLEEHVLSGAP